MRVRATLLLTVGFLLSSESPAEAHGGDGVEASNYRTRVIELSPDLPGVRVRAIEGGDRLELTNTSGAEVVVLGYEEEPYLRVGPSGVFENQSAPTRTADLHEETSDEHEHRDIEHEQEDADASDAPRWKRISSGNVARWHDHRVHWTGEDPPEVRSDPGKTQRVAVWAITLRSGNSAAVLAGDVQYVAAPSAIPAYVLGVLGLLVMARSSMRANWRVAISVGLGSLVIADIVHTFGELGADGAGIGEQLTGVVSANPYSLIAWLVAIAAVVLLRTRPADGAFAAIFVAILIGLTHGLTDLQTLSKSQLPTDLPAGLARGVVALIAGLSLGLVIGASFAIRKQQLLTNRATAEEHP